MKKSTTLLFNFLFFYSSLLIVSCGTGENQNTTNECFVYFINSFEVQAGSAMGPVEIGGFGLISEANYLITVERSGDFEASNLHVIHNNLGVEFTGLRLVKPADKILISAQTFPNMSGQESIKIKLTDTGGSSVCEILFTIKIKIKNTAKWNVAFSGNSDWNELPVSGYYLEELGFGDFDGDMKTDILVPTGTEWLISYGGNSDWTRLADSGYKLDELGFGDFDGDGKTDILRTSGTEWTVAYGGNSDWTRLADSGYKLNELGFGDFDGDGKTDILRTSGTEWTVAYGGNSDWTRLADSGYKLNELGFGDFDGDGKTDILRTSGTEWTVAYGGNSDWTRLADSGYKLNELGFGDFDGDGKTDILRTSGTEWTVAYGGNSDWTRLADSGYKLDELSIGTNRMNVHPWINYGTMNLRMVHIDFNGDKKTDILRTN